MEDRKRIGRGLEEIYHLFLSHGIAGDEKTSTETLRHAHAEKALTLPSEGLAGKGASETVSGLFGKRARSWLFCSKRLVAEKAILVCNLALELSRRGLSVGLIETTAEMPNVFFLLGSLLPQSGQRERRGPVAKRPQHVPSGVPPQAPLRPIDISAGYSGILRAVFLDHDLDCIESVTLLNRLMKQSDFLLINIASDISRLRGMIALVDPFVIVPSAIYSEDLLDSYLLIKKISQELCCSTIGHLIAGEQSYSRAEAASSIVAQMAAKFVHTEVCFLGRVSIEADVPMAILTRTPILLGAPNSRFCVGIREVADALIGREDHPTEKQRVEAEE